MCEWVPLRATEHGKASAPHPPHQPAKACRGLYIFPFFMFDHLYSALIAPATPPVSPVNPLSPLTLMFGLVLRMSVCLTTALQRLRAAASASPAQPGPAPGCPTKLHVARYPPQ